MLRTIRLRWIVATLVLAIVAPLGVFATVSVQRAWRGQLANVDRQNAATVRAISVAIDNLLDRTTSALDVLGELHALDDPELPAFESLAARILPYQPTWSAILLTDRDGRVIDGVPDRDDGGATARGVNWARAAVGSRRTTVSDMFTLTSGEPHVMVAVPVVRKGQVSLILGARVRTGGITDALRQQQTPPGGAVAIIGSDYRLVARTGPEQGFIGTLANQSVIDASQRQREGTLKTINRDGEPTYAAFSRSPATGLIVALGLPAEHVDGPIRRIMLQLVAGWLVVLVLGGGLAALLGGVIVHALSSASQAAAAIARGDAVSPRPSRIAELDALAMALRQTGETLEARDRERKEASRLKDEFLMTISHELRTPLTAICGWARLLSTGQMREEQRPRAIDAIDRNANALQQLVDDLLDVSRIVTGKLRLDVQPLSLNDVVVSAIDAIRPAADAKSIQVVVVPDPLGAPVSGDAGRLQQVVWNLLSNAVKFTPAGGRIEVVCRLAGETVHLTVRDSGIGIEPDFLPHVFDRFRQGVSGTTRAAGGLGLGLSIVRHLVELHGGTVTGENNIPPPGATFVVMVPARLAKNSVAAVSRATTAAPETWPTSAAG